MKVPAISFTRRRLGWKQAKLLALLKRGPIPRGDRLVVNQPAVMSSLVIRGLVVRSKTEYRLA